jgi:hypothetical protein
LQPWKLHNYCPVNLRLQLCRDHLGDQPSEDLPVLYAALGALYEPAGQPLWVACAWLAGELYRLLDRFGDDVLRALRPTERVSALARLEWAPAGLPALLDRCRLLRAHRVASVPLRCAIRNVVLQP